MKSTHDANSTKRDRTRRSTSKVTFTVESRGLRTFTATINGDPIGQAQPIQMKPPRGPNHPDSRTAGFETARQEIASRRPLSLALLPSVFTFDDRYRNPPLYTEPCDSDCAPRKHEAFALQCATLTKLNECDQSEIDRLAAEDSKFKDDATPSGFSCIHEPVRLRDFCSLVGRTLARTASTNATYNKTARSYYKNRTIPTTLHDPALDPLLSAEFISAYFAAGSILERGRVPHELSNMTDDELATLVEAQRAVRRGLSHYTDTNDKVDVDSVADADGTYPTLRDLSRTLASEWSCFLPKFEKASAQTSKLDTITGGTEEASIVDSSSHNHPE